MKIIVGKISKSTIFQGQFSLVTNQFSIFNGKRRGGDSNPRHGFCSCNCLAGSPVRPLQHLSVVEDVAPRGRNPSIIGPLSGSSPQFGTLSFEQDDEKRATEDRGYHTDRNLRWSK